MTYKEKVDYLKSYKDKYNYWVYLNQRIEGVKGITYQELPKGEGKTINDYLYEKEKLEEEMNEIRKTIDSVKDERCKFVLKHKFIHFNSLEETAEIMQYSLRQTQRFYKVGVNSIKKL